MPQKHVILGAGQIGTGLANRLAKLGHYVVAVRRTAASPRDGVRTVAGDVSDLTFAREMGKGADVVYHVMNPAYHLWQTELPPLTDGVIAAATSSGARLVVLDNLYMHGGMNGVAITETTAQEPCSKKGALRKQMFDKVMAAQSAGAIRVAYARASDFIGPGVEQGHISSRFFDAVLKGKAGDLLGDPKLPHAFTYIDDVVATLATLGSDDRGLGQTWIVPTLQAAPVTVWLDALGVALNRKIKTRVAPAWMLGILGVFVPIMRELKEMRYQWESPYRVDDSKFRKAFGAAATPFAQQVTETAAWALQRVATK
jgi:nucleoside-diphosphate-sugar epimerase